MKGGVASTVPGLGDSAAREAIRKSTLSYPPLFITRYFKDEKNKPIVLKSFHLVMLDAIVSAKEKKILIEVPAGHGKTTLCSRFAPIYRMTTDPNIRIMHIMNNATDAEQNLAAIQRELEDPRSLLVQEQGPYKGPIWKATEFHLAGRTIIDKDATFAAYGTGSNVFGHRADVVICDDILNLTNSGPHVSDGTREAVKEWFFQGVLKVVGEEGKVVVIGTPMDYRDLYHELEKPQHGFKVIKMKALNEDDEALWPERFSKGYLIAERESDPTSFAKRRQCEAIPDEMLTFPIEDLMACRNKERLWGEITLDMRAAKYTTVINAFDPTSGQTKTSKWCGFASLAFNPKEPAPRRYFVLEQYHFRAPFEEQINFIINKHLQYNARTTVIEANGAHQYLLQSATLKAFRDSGHSVEPHYTDARNKPDPEVGIPGMAAVVKAHLLEFPYGDELSRKWTNYVIQNELGKHPMMADSDVLMALWFAFLRAMRMGGLGLRSYKKPLPFWARGYGLGPGFKREVVRP